MRYDQPSLPNPNLEERTLEAVARFLLSPECKKVAVISGAGISAANGIPTYRGAGGLYETLDATRLTASAEDRAALATPEAVFSRQLFLRNPLPCLEMKRDFVLDVQRGAYAPTLFHRLVELIAARTGKLVRVYDQNIDGLMHACTQLPPHVVRNPHGRVDRAACERCGFGVSFDAFCAHMRSSVRDISGADPSAPATSSPMVCAHCGAPSVKPASVLFGAPLALDVPPELDDALDEVDVLIIAGTTLKVAPINGVPCFVPPTCVRVVLNDSPVGEELQPMPLEYGPHAARDVFLRTSIDASSLELIAACGWLPTLHAALAEPAFAMPPSSRRMLGARLLGETMPAALPSDMRRRRYADDDADADAVDADDEASEQPPDEDASRTRLCVRTPAALERAVCKSADGRLFVVLRRHETGAQPTGGICGDDDEEDADLAVRPIMIADRSHHDTSQSVRSWLQTAVTGLAHRLPPSLPAAAKRDAAAQCEALRACLSLRAGGFELHINDPTGASRIV